MNIIKLEPSATGYRPPIQSWNGYGIPDGYIEVPEGVNTSAMQTHMGFVDLTIEDGVLTAIVGNDEAYQAYASTIPDPLDELKIQKIQQSKDDLETYLATHPLQWADGEYYSITAEKQNQLTSKIMAATMAQTMSTDYTLTWNSTGEVCKEWALTDLYALAFAIDARVTALVSYQQTQEVAMKNAATLDELNSIEVDYDTVQ